MKAAPTRPAKAANPALRLNDVALLRAVAEGLGFDSSRLVVVGALVEVVAGRVEVVVTLL